MAGERANAVRERLGEGRRLTTPRARVIAAALRHDQPFTAQDLVRELSRRGVGRATVFRWVGSREQLYGEICSQLFTKQLERAEQAAKGKGVDKLIDILEALLRALANAAPLRYFVEQDPEFAMRVLTSRASPVQYRCVQQIRELVFQLVPEPALPAEELAYIIVRVTESFLYRDVITGDSGDIDAAVRAIRVLLTAPPEKKRRR
jgi:AcrR family transcriptional regulator